VAEKCLGQGFHPDTISSDATTNTLNGPVFDTLTTLSKFLAIGMTTAEVLRAASWNPARAFAYGFELGSFRKGSEADVSILELRDGTFSFIDSSKEARTGKHKLFPVKTFLAGKAYEAAREG
jgi:dihydroorotase